MKAINVQQPFAFEIMSGRKTIEVMDWDTLHRGDLLICASRKPAFNKDDMDEMEEEYQCTFLYGHALCIVRVVDVRPMEKGDVDKALLEKVDPEAYSWVIEDVRLVCPFPVKGNQGLFDVDDRLITVSPFSYGETVVVKKGTIAKDFGLDFSGWHGRTTEIPVMTDEEPRVRVEWDSLSLRTMPLDAIERCEKEGFDWTGVLLRFNELAPAEPRDTQEDVEDSIDRIMEENSSMFEE